MTAALTCPRDHQPLAPLKYESHIEVDACPACQGMWLDQGELEAIQKSSEHDYAKQLDELPNDVADSIHVAQQEALDPIRCPKCDSEMEAREYAYCSRVIVDTCPEGCGVWLDKGEIQALELFFERAQAEASEGIPLRYRLWASLRELMGK